MLRKGGDKPALYNDYENVGAGVTPPESLQFFQEDELRTDR